MGISQSLLPEEDIHDYEEITYLSKNDILRAYKRVQHQVAKSKRDPHDLSNMVLHEEDLKQMPELMHNPFADRICHVFSSRKDGTLTFEDYLDMLSVFSDAAPKSVKTAYAFKLYDFDNDELLSKGDLHELVTRLTTSEKLSGLTNEEKQQIVKYILQEADLDENGYISLTEFELVVSKSPDFMKTFCIRI